MSQESVRVVAHLRAKAGKEQELKALLLSLLKPTRMEKGCREYRLYQSKQEVSDMTFVEEWDSDEALDAHLQTPHVQTVLAQVPALIYAPPDIRRYRLVG